MGDYMREVRSWARLGARNAQASKAEFCKGYNKYTSYYRCPGCKQYAFKNREEKCEFNINYCMHCGQKLELE